MTRLKTVIVASFNSCLLSRPWFVQRFFFFFFLVVVFFSLSFIHGVYKSSTLSAVFLQNRVAFYRTLIMKTFLPLSERSTLRFIKPLPPPRSFLCRLIDTKLRAKIISVESDKLPRGFINYSNFRADSKITIISVTAYRYYNYRTIQNL